MFPFYQSKLPLIGVDPSSGTFKAWEKGDLTHVEEVLTGEIREPPNTYRHAQALAHRALIRSRLKQHELAIEDAKMSNNVERSTIGHVAIAIARAGNDEIDAAIRLFDIVFTSGTPVENHLLLLIKAVLLFQCGRYEEAVARIEDLVAIVDKKEIYKAVRAQMHFLLGGMSLSQGDYEQAVELLEDVGEAVPPKECPQLRVISLLFGWDFDGLPLAIKTSLQQCAKTLEDLGDAAMQSKNAEDATAKYSSVLSLDPSNLTGLLVKRSKAQAMLASWDESLEDANAAIEADPKNPWGYERRYMALDALQRPDDAVNTLNDMLSLMERSVDPDTQHDRHYGDAAFGHLLEDIVTRSGEKKVLAWTGKASSYNSCLPATFSVDPPNQPVSQASTTEVDMGAQVAAIKSSLSPSDALLIHDRLTRLPPIRFANQRLFLPCIAFPVKKLVKKGTKGGKEKSYRARVSGIGHVEFTTSDSLSLTEPRKLTFAYPWIRDLRVSLDDANWATRSASDGEEYKSDSDGETKANSESSAAVFILETVPESESTDGHAQTLQLIVQLQQPFRALLLQQQPSGGFKRIAAQHEIVAPGLERPISSTKDIRTEVLEIW